jgi:hypothetical protein
MRASLLALTVASLAACATPDASITTDGLPLEREQGSAFMSWAGDFVSTEGPGDFPAWVYGLSLAIDPARPTAGATYTIVYRGGRLEQGTFTWSGRVTVTHAALVLTPDPKASDWVRTITLARGEGQHAITTSGLDFAADPTGESVDTVVEPLRDGTCAVSACGHREHCQDAAFIPDAPVTRHACVADGHDLVGPDLG